MSQGGTLEFIQYNVPGGLLWKTEICKLLVLIYNYRNRSFNHKINWQFELAQSQNSRSNLYQRTHVKSVPEK